MIRRGQAWVRWWRDEHGQVSAFVVTLVAGIVLLAGLVLDGGLALGAKVEAIGHAQSAARAGAQHLNLAAYRASGALRLDPDEAAVAARNYLASVGARGTVTVTRGTIEVTVTASSGTQLLGLVGIGSIEVTGAGSAQPLRAAGALP